MAKITPEQACIDYALAKGRVDNLTLTIKKSKCANIIAYEQAWASSREVSELPGHTCIEKHWELVTVDNYGNVERAMEFDEMCVYCQAVQKAVDERKVYKIKFGAAKRTLALVGKRLLKEREV